MTGNTRFHIECASTKHVLAGFYIVQNLLRKVKAFLQLLWKLFRLEGIFLNRSVIIHTNRIYMPYKYDGFIRITLCSFDKSVSGVPAYKIILGLEFFDVIRMLLKIIKSGKIVVYILSHCTFAGRLFVYAWDSNHFTRKSFYFTIRIKSHNASNSIYYTCL